MISEFYREYQGHLPLPLAQLYSRAYNAKYPRSQHDNTFYLFEALVKLSAAPLIAMYVHEVRHGVQRVKSLDSQLERLALPSLGHWVGMVRELSKYFGTRADATHHPLGHLWEQLNRQHRNKPGLLSLYQHIKNGPNGELASNRSCSILEVLDTLVHYRNVIMGHGAEREEAFYEHHMGPLLLPAVNEVLAGDIFSPLGPPSTRLVYLDDIRVLSETVLEVSLEELVGYRGERAAPVHVSREEAQELVPHCVAVFWPGRSLPLPLAPLLVYRKTEPLPEVLFLNGDRNHRRIEYLSYTTGQIDYDEIMAPAIVKLLSLVTGQPVTAEGLKTLQQQSLATTSSSEIPTKAQSAPSYLLGEYEILAEIGRGGMGVVYLARQLSLGRIVALKMLPDDLARDAVALARFQREMHALAKCDHPHIIKRVVPQ